MTERTKKQVKAPRFTVLEQNMFNLWVIFRGRECEVGKDNMKVARSIAKKLTAFANRIESVKSKKTGEHDATY